MSSNKGKYFEVEETFKEGDVELKVVESIVCKNCFYAGKPCHDLAPSCYTREMDDCLNVIFIRNE